MGDQGGNQIPPAAADDTLLALDVALLTNGFAQRVFEPGGVHDGVVNLRPAVRGARARCSSRAMATLAADRETVKIGCR